MTDRPRNTGLRRGLRLILLLQIAIAGMMLVIDIPAQLPPGLFDRERLPTGPISPGDQTRRYDPQRSPSDFMDRTSPADIALPDQFADRLQFELRETEGMGNLLLLTGAIAPGDADRMAEELDSLIEPPDGIALHSPGGTVSEARAIGRIIRDRGFPTLVLAGASCMSSCPYVFAAGAERTASRQGAIGMHQHYYDQSRFIPAVFAVSDIQRGQGETLEYLIDMGIDPAVMIYSLKTPPERIYVLVEDELLETGLATNVID
ncbi:hypothetical protein ACFORG_02530 [Lutimaribacter marinistellae]|uniref:Clp protease n=1 Tax=Lutimaribacter marinistellae TaxID=1820329 RepID=A0ABV7TEX5_9RHOB